MLKKLKSLFVVEDENQQNQAAPDVEKTEPTIPSTSGNNKQVQQNIEYDSDSSTPPNQRFVDILLKAIEANNLDGFDYIEFKNSLHSLSKMNMDEPTRYKSAYAMAQTMGTSVDKLVQSGNHYLDVLAKEHNKFQNAVKNQLDSQVNGRKQQITELKSSIESKKKKIAELQKEIEQESKQLDELNNDLTSAAEKVKSTENSFNHAYDSVVKQIKNDIQQMNNYLK
ncbi:MAG TPA: hypothetical protein PK147_09065 [Saprospiraceae bacterium]|nr:hypothetical protein [Saprospiraceae bacterium]MCB9328676.1 hypothetical protein [Lewinellaceae bacterium]HPQ21987.1 hypothetical protein [Saprospiraceae bacterium]HRX28291.1 hypothetical protein [Saprospiraceae bacterium]